MKKLETFQKIHDLGPKKFFALLFLGAADVFCIAAPYYLKSIIPNVQNYLHIDESHLATATSILGWVTLLSQLPGGWLADKVSSRKLLMIAVFFTGVGTLWMGGLVQTGTGTNNEALIAQYYVIFAMWGISTTPFFWTPLWKLVSHQADKKNQGFVYGMEGSLNGILGVFFVFIIGTIVTEVIKKNPSNFIPFAAYVYIFGAILVLLTFGIYFFVIEKPSSEKFALNVKSFLKVMSDWKLWMLSFFVLGMYMFQSTFAYYLNQMLQNVIAIPTIALTILGGLRLYGIRFVISPFVGKIADKLRSMTLLLLITLFIGFILIAIFLFLPGVSTDPTHNIFNTLPAVYKQFVAVALYAIFFVSAILSWTMVTLRYTQIAEYHRPNNSYATTVALLSFVGFSSDAWFYNFSTVITKNYNIAKTTYSSQTGYQIILGVGLIVSVIGWICGLIVFLTNYKSNKKWKLNFYRWRELNNV